MPEATSLWACDVCQDCNEEGEEGGEGDEIRSVREGERERSSGCVCGKYTIGERAD